MLEISRLSLSLGQQTLLRDLSLTLHPGQVHVIIGPNGTGKTSLMRTLFGELTPDSGDIRLGDQSARQMTQARWRQQFGYMPQNIQLELDLSVIEVVVLGRLDSLSMRLADEDILAAGRALQAQLEFAGTVTGEHRVGVAIDQARRDQRLGFDHLVGQ